MHSRSLKVRGPRFNISPFPRGKLRIIQGLQERERDGAAFEQLVKRYDHSSLGSLQYVTHIREDSQDAIQEAFRKIFAS